jgi:hypothetical protein
MRSESRTLSTTSPVLPVANPLGLERHPRQQHIELRPIERLVEYALNPRKNDSAVDRMCGSIREFGFKIPILARSDGEVIDGHLRLRKRTV